MTQTTAGRITEIIREHLKFYAGSGEWAAAVEAGQEIAAEIDALTRERDEARAEVERLRPAAEAWGSCVATAKEIWTFGHERGGERQMLQHVEYLLAGIDARQRNDEMAANLPTWIHATVLLPKSGEFVLAWDGQRMIRAMYAKRFTEAANPGGEEEATEYSDELDGYFLLEGWFEHNAFEAIHWTVDRPVTHWMPLPAPPGVNNG